MGRIGVLDAARTKNTCHLGQGSKCCSFLFVGLFGYECAKTPGNEEVRETIAGRRQMGTMIAKADLCVGPPTFHLTPVEHGAYRAACPETSKEAAMAFTGARLNRIHRDILDWAVDFGPFTDGEMEDALLAKHPGFSTLRARRVELVRNDWLENSGIVRRNRNNRNMIVWKLSKEWVPNAD